ncbi:Beta/Gamma crystallin [Nannocystis exedens]|uniref:Beta/Gamma crystallin n=1 Tax=Nannocystis exedens TaxID=54 RepID=A0A1I2I9L4_9BACT|nr:hypothetical protein [Nannocystis exedens]PCC74108.1 Development-specific protein S [Nannocystis exedens]SFF38300.1 Beta/Gamma crystallin [Nannocystis exedens]
MFTARSIPVRSSVRRSRIVLALPVVTLATLLGLEARAEAACACTPTPGSGQVTVWQHAEFTGECCTLTVGDYADSASFKLSNDSISSLKVGPGVRAVLYEHGGFAGREATYEASQGYAHLHEVSDETSSIRIVASDPRVPYYYEGNYPYDDENEWSNQAQGLANDGVNWYVTQTGRVSRIPLTCDLADASCIHETRSIAEVRAAFGLPGGYDHFGDPDHHAGYLFVPVEGIAAGLPPIVVALSTPDLAPVAFASVYVTPGAYNSAWVTVDPRDGSHLYQAGGTLDATRGVRSHRIDWSRLQLGLDGFLTYEDNILLEDHDGDPLTLYTQQGGELLTNGVLFLTNSKPGGSGAGLRAFDLETGTLLARAGSNYGPFDFELNDADSSLGDEAEGIDFLGISPASGVPGIPEGALHVLMVNVDIDRDNAFLKHYSYFCDPTDDTPYCAQH